jgi:hypothetical protein
MSGCAHPEQDNRLIIQRQASVIAVNAHKGRRQRHNYKYSGRHGFL